MPKVGLEPNIIRKKKFASIAVFGFYQGLQSVFNPPFLALKPVILTPKNHLLQHDATRNATRIIGSYGMGQPRNGAGFLHREVKLNSDNSPRLCQ